MTSRLSFMFPSAASWFMAIRPLRPPATTHREPKRRYDNGGFGTYWRASKTERSYFRKLKDDVKNNGSSGERVVKPAEAGVPVEQSTTARQSYSDLDCFGRGIGLHVQHRISVGHLYEHDEFSESHRCPRSLKNARKSTVPFSRDNTSLATPRDCRRGSTRAILACKMVVPDAVLPAKSTKIPDQPPQLRTPNREA